MTGTADSVRWGNTTICYRFRHADRKTLAITVNPDLSVVVVAPTGTAPEVIQEKVRHRAGWIRRTAREFELYLPKQPPRRYVNGETHRYLGRQYRLRAERGAEDSVKCLRGWFHITTQTDPSPELSRRMLEHWYRNRAEHIIRERLAHCHRRARAEGIPYPPVTIRKMKTRWGSCSDQGRVTLNQELIKAPKDCIDYVIMHELCHLKEHHHGRRFWRLLQKLMPDYERRRRRLNLMADL